MLSTKPLLGAVIFAASTLCATAQTTQPEGTADRIGSTESTWIAKAAQGGMAEIELGKLAVTRAASEAVKQFGQRMLDDHTKVNSELTSLATKKGVTLPAELDPKDSAARDRLSKLSGDAFDRAYMSDMVKDHQTDVAEFEKQANSGKDPDVKAFAANTLPTLQEHLRMAESTQQGLKK